MGDSKNWKINKNNNSEVNSNTKDKYKLREASIKKRIEVEHRKKQPKKRGPKPRPKAQPMSKYRRKTANLRERQRMGEINTAFDKLREKIPTPIQAKNAKLEKLTKINILHVAINYIRALESILDTGDAGVQIYGTSIVQSPYLPLPPEPEMPPEKVTKNPPKPNQANIVKILPQKTLLRTKNPSSSSSVDSGIQMDEEPEESDEPGVEPEPEPDEPVICPDWTELTSTLELIPPRGNLDTLLSSTTAADIAPKFVLH